MKPNAITAIIAIAAGAALTILHNRADILQWIIAITAILILIPALITLVNVIRTRRHTLTSTVAAIGAAALAVIMLADPTPFAQAMVWIFAAILIITAILQITACARLSLPWPLYITPILSIAAAAIITLTPLRTVNATVTLIAGIALTVTGINSLLQQLNTPKTT